MRLAHNKVGRDIANSFMTHPAILPDISDDHTDMDNKSLGSTLLSFPMVWMLQPSEYVLLMLVPLTLVLYDVHTMIKPKGRGIQAVHDVRRAAKWFFEDHANVCEKICTFVPEFNKPAKVFARKVGMIEQGVMTKSFRKNGILHDQTILGLDKETFLCQR